MIRLVGLFNPLVRELNETLYQFERPFISDSSKFQGRVRTIRADPSSGGGEADGGMVPKPLRRVNHSDLAPSRFARR